MTTYHYCQLTALLKDHLMSLKPGTIVFIHSISNYAREIDETVSALESVALIPLVPIQRNLPHTTLSPFHLTSSTIDIDSLPLCEKCFHHIDEIESVIRDSVVSVLADE